ncbi:sugar transferase, partial [bacterium]
MQPLPKSRAVWKRTLDIVLSATFLIILLPLFLVIALLVKLTSRGPCLYKAQRIGLGGVPFYNLKFRSMHTDADRRIAEVWGSNDKEGPFFKVKSDPRITPIGRFIRRYSLDEMPQLWNVLRGEVSLVGPRALHD